MAWAGWGCSSGEDPEPNAASGSGGGATGSASAGSGGSGGSESRCSDGVKNGAESDVDCGAVCAALCAQGKGCQASTDCQTAFCADGLCAVKPGSLLWQRTAGDALDQIAQDVVVDAAGNVYVTGRFIGSTSFGGPALVSASPAAYDGFIAKLSRDGTHLWSQRFGGAGEDYGFSVAVDAANGVYVAGRFEQTADFGASSAVSAGKTDGFVLKLDGSDGKVTWVKSFGGLENDAARRVAVGTDGQVYVGGSFSGTVSFGGAALVSKGGEDALVLKLDASGSHVFSRGFGGPKEEIFGGIDVNMTGDVYITGSFDETADFGGGTLTAAGSGMIDRRDAFLAKLDAAGQHVFSQRFGGTKDERGVAIAVDRASGAFYMSGIFSSTSLSVGGAELVNGGDYDTYLAKLDAAGQHLWSKGLGGAGYDVVAGITFDGVGNTYVTGAFGGSVDFGGGALVAQGTVDVFVAAYSAGGAHQWSQRMGGPGENAAFSVGINSSGDLYLAGWFKETVNFGAEPLVSKGERDVFVLKLGENPPK